MVTVQGLGNAKITTEIAEACNNWVGSLNSQQKAKATFDFVDGERIFWSYPPLNRHGLPLRDMDPTQRDLAYSILDVTLAPDTALKAKQIMEHELVLGPLEVEEGTADWDRNPELYFWTVFGQPGSEGPWGWRVEGHHVSLHINCWGDKVISVTPFFLGANPAEVLKGDKQGLRILDRREDLAVELISSLTEDQKSKAIIHDKAPWDVLMYNSSRAVVHDNEGLPGSELSGSQKETLLSLIAEYVNGMRSDIAEEKMGQIRQQGVDDFRLVWSGVSDRSRDHYYRLHGGNFIVEFVNIQNGANHIHSVWRDVANDFGEEVMRDTKMMYKIL